MESVETASETSHGIFGRRRFCIVSGGGLAPFSSRGCVRIPAASRGILILLLLLFLFEHGHAAAERILPDA